MMMYRKEHALRVRFYYSGGLVEARRWWFYRLWWTVRLCRHAISAWNIKALPPHFNLICLVINMGPMACLSHLICFIIELVHFVDGVRGIFLR